MNRIFLFLVFIGAATALAGCVTPKATDQPTSYASYVGDRASVAFDEVVVSVSVEPHSQPYQNLHVAFAAIINPKKDTTSHPSDVAWILRRIEPRMDSAVVKLLTDGGAVSLQKLAPLRDQLSITAQSVVAETLSHWTHASDYEVQVVVVSMYLTDASVGRPARGRVSPWFD